MSEFFFSCVILSLFKASSPSKIVYTYNSVSSSIFVNCILLISPSSSVQKYTLGSRSYIF